MIQRAPKTWTCLRIGAGVGLCCRGSVFDKALQGRMVH